MSMTFARRDFRVRDVRGEELSRGEPACRHAGESPGDDSRWAGWKPALRNPQVLRHNSAGRPELQRLPGSSESQVGRFLSRLHEDFGNFEALLAESRLEGIHDARIEVASGSLYDGVSCFERGESFAIGPIAD